MPIVRKPNIGRIDQIIRFLISLAMIYIGFIDDQLIPDRLSATILGIFGVINLVVAFVRYCPLYAVTGINTYSEPRHD